MPRELVQSLHQVGQQRHAGILRVESRLGEDGTRTGGAEQRRDRVASLDVILLGVGISRTGRIGG